MAKAKSVKKVKKLPPLSLEEEKICDLFMEILAVAEAAGMPEKRAAAIYDELWKYYDQICPGCYQHVLTSVSKISTRKHRRKAA